MFWTFFCVLTVNENVMVTIRKTVLYFVLVYFVLFCSTHLHSATKTWGGDVSNDWNTAANWNGNTLPSTADDIIIALVVNHLIIDETVTCKSLQVDGRLDITFGANVTVTTDFMTEIGSTFNIDGGAISIGDDWESSVGPRHDS